ncbi:MAG: Fe-Mn family superoxide dismutase [Candidatus Paceibacterota bacterium]
MPHYKEQSFNLPDEFHGKLSRKSVDEHLKLYGGYVKHTNTILEKVEELERDDLEGNKFTIESLRRRLGFEFDGMRNHEIYFAQLEDGPQELTDDSKLKNAISSYHEDFDTWLADFKQMAKTRGIGWAVLYYDQHADQLLNVWVDEQHLGHLTGVEPILMLDMWEHSFVFDYQPSGKGEYIDDFFANLNWSVIEENFANAKK